MSRFSHALHQVTHHPLEAASALFPTSVGTSLLPGAVAYNVAKPFPHGGPGVPGEDNSNEATLKAQLDALQQDVDARNSAMKDLVDRYPDIVAMNLHDISSKLGPEYDASDQLVMKNAADQLSAYYQARSGGFSSGAFNEGVAKQAADLATNRRNTFIGMADQGWQQQYNEMSSQRNFQAKMLGQQTQNLFDWQSMMAKFNHDDAQQQADLNEKRRQSWMKLGGDIGSIATNVGLSSMFAAPGSGGGGSSGSGGGGGSSSSGVPSYASSSPNPYGNDASAGWGA